MSAEYVIAEGRRFSEAQFVDTFTVFRRTGNTVTDPVTLVEGPEYATVHADVSGKLKAGEARPADASVLGSVWAESALQWHTSVSVLGVLVGDEVECTAALTDPDLVGTRVRVAGPFLKSLATARRFPVTELS